jgi:Glycosyl hydrolases family 38 C-terminal domain
LIKYINNYNESTFVKVRLEKGTENVAFEVSFARLNLTSDLNGKDVTINW